MLKEDLILPWDARRDILISPNQQQAAATAAQHWIHSAKRSIQQRGRFAVALSGGSTPKAIYRELCANYKTAIDWTKVHLFWSDERAVPPDHENSNYRMAMESGFKDLPIPLTQIHRMKAEKQGSATDYEDLLRRELGPPLFDLVMLGVGEDGHTASLFPKTAALDENAKLVVSNYLPERDEWRMTLTTPCINQSARTAFYVWGEAKQAIALLVLSAAIKSSFPASAIGTAERKALWLMDREASHLLKS